ncbi:MAG: YncE family protein [Deltaproteobacteria bacterium]|nr:MAG: YncE family protein [Deltaproteobacteria bacterium]
MKRPANLAAEIGFIFILIYNALSGGCTYNPVCDEVPGGVLKDPVGMTVKEEFLYVTNANADKEYCSGFISKVDLDNSKPNITNIPAEFEGESFSYLGGIAISENYAYVAERSSHSLLKFDLDQEKIVARTLVGEDPFGVTVTVVGPTTIVLVTNMSSDDVSVIDAGSMGLIELIPLDYWTKPTEIAVSGEKAYVVQQNSSKISVIDLALESDNYLKVIGFIDWEGYCQGIASNGKELYVSKRSPNSLAFINTESNSVLDIIDLDSNPDGVAVKDNLILVANFGSDNVYVINAATNDLITIVEVGDGPTDIEISGDYAYVTNYLSRNISVIDTNTLKVTVIP